MNFLQFVGDGKNRLNTVNMSETSFNFLTSTQSVKAYCQMTMII